MTTSLKLSAVALLASFVLAGCQTTKMVNNNPVAHAVLNSTTTAAAMGNINFTPAPTGIHVYGSVTGLEPNSVHAIHIHEKPDCGNAGEAAGGHFNPMKTLHGHPESMTSHSGELPNITANASGIATLDFINPRISVNPLAANSVYNHAIIVHAKADDYQSQPSGNAGGRVACGIIVK